MLLMAIKVYVFSKQSMIEDLINSGIVEEKLSETIEEILSKIRLLKIVEAEDVYIVGGLVALILCEQYKVNAYEEILI